MRVLWQTLAVLCFAVLPTSVQPRWPQKHWVVDGTVYVAHAAPGAGYSIVETGESEYRFEVRPGDRWSRDAQKRRERERAELKSNTQVAFDVGYRVTYEMLVEGPLPVEGHIVAGQWHATEDAGDRPTSPPFSMELWGSDLVAMTRSIAEPVHRQGPKSIERYRMRGIAPGRWYTISYDIRFSPTAGALVLHIDGAQVYAGSIPIGFNDARGPYFKFGVYRPAASTRAAIRYRGLEIRALQTVAAHLRQPDPRRF